MTSDIKYAPSFEENVIFRNDNMSKTNNLTLMNVDHITATELQENYPVKNNNLNHGTQNIFINSSFNIPSCYSYEFKDLMPERSIALKEKKPMFMDSQQDFNIETNTQTKARPFMFTDSIAHNKSINRDIILPSIGDDETHIKLNGLYQQEHKVVNTNHDSTWNTSRENSITGKSQRQQHASATEDQSVVYIPETHDIEAEIGGKKLGKKLIRGDYMSQDDDNGVSENLSRI
jgi:hypothetical protein